MSEPSLVDGSRPETPRELLARLDGLGIRVATVSHAPVFTVDQAKALRGSLRGAHVKNLFVRDEKGAMWLVVALEDREIDLRALARALGHKRFSFASVSRLGAFLGVAPGAVTPFAVVNDRTGAVRVALDEGLRGLDPWNFHPLDNALTTSISGEDMLRFLAEVDHEPIWVDLQAIEPRDA